MSLLFPVLLAMGYLFLLSRIVVLSEKRSAGKWMKKLNTSTWIYSLSLAVYCTAWTYYGSVGRAVSHGIDFLTIYLGPLLASVVFVVVLRKMVKISSLQKIHSLSDFISIRYGRSISLGVLVAIFTMFGIIPYVALQIKSIQDSIEVLNMESGDHYDLGLVFAFGLTMFTSFFGLRKLDLSEKHPGIVGAIAFESLLKLLVLLIVGGLSFLVINNNGGWFSNLDLIQQPELDGFHWMSMIVLSFFAIFLLPRQFQMAVVENNSDHQLVSASWQFPLYLLVINLCVIPIAYAGKSLFGEGVNPDYYVLHVALSQGGFGLGVLSFLGGFAAASGMIIVSTIALATMLTNNIFLPITVKGGWNKGWLTIQQKITWLRRFSVFFVMLLAYLYYRFVTGNAQLVSIGLTSFAAVAQFAPATFGGMYWKKGNKRGAITGIVVGMLLWFYLLIFPNLLAADLFPTNFKLFFDNAPLLNPTHFMGMDMPSQISAGVFWSLLMNTLLYIGFSVFSIQGNFEYNQAEIFVDIDKFSKNIEENLFWRGTAMNKDLMELMYRFLGDSKAKQAIRIFETRYMKSNLAPEQRADRKFVTYAENVLTGLIGTSSARIMVRSVTREEEVQMEDVLSILRESREILKLNERLTKTTEDLAKITQDLQRANELLRQKDEIKDEFLYTITHEIRTPITSIRAFTEILQDHEDLSPEEKKKFLDIMGLELVRLSRLISSVLDLEKYESGKYHLDLQNADINGLIMRTIGVCEKLAKEKNCTIQLDLTSHLDSFSFDVDKMQQVLTNLISNGIKHAPAENGWVKVGTYYIDEEIRVTIKDNGPGISEGEELQIFDKFYQIKSKESKHGTGLGLAISKQIVQLHKGRIWVDTDYSEGAKFIIALPQTNE